MNIKTAPLKPTELYLDECEQWLSGKRSALPNPDHLLCGVPSPSFIGARTGVDEIGPFIAARIRDSQPGRVPLIFDPGYFAFLRLVEHSGALIRFHMNKRRSHPLRKDYLVISGATKAHGMVRVLRVITDAPLDMSVAQLPADYHEYRRAVLGLVVRRRGTPPKSDRSTCIELAVGVFTSGEPRKALSKERYRSLLESGLLLADTMHERMHAVEEEDDE